MLRRSILLFACLGLAACGTAINPLNWFQGSDDGDIPNFEIVDRVEVTDPRGLVPEVLSLTVDQVPQGAIVQATGLPPTQGFWDADLVEVDRTDGNLVYEFRILPPLRSTPQGTPQSREILAGTTLSVRELAGIRSITVLGAENRRAVRR